MYHIGIIVLTIPPICENRKKHVAPLFETCNKINQAQYRIINIAEQTWEYFIGKETDFVAVEGFFQKGPHRYKKYTGVPSTENSINGTNLLMRP